MAKQQNAGEQGQKKDYHLTTQKFIQLLESATLKSLSFVPLEEFADAYKKMYTSFKPLDETIRPPLAGSSREAERIRLNMHERVVAYIKEDITQVVEADGLDNLFSLLEQLKIESSEVRRPGSTRRISVDAEIHMKPFNTALKLKQKNRLLRLVKSEREKLSILKARVESKRANDCSMHSALQEQCVKVEKVIITAEHNQI